jgi:hypothetical protein
MSLEKQRQIQELYFIKHRHDKKFHTGYNWQDNLLKNTTTPYIWKNPVMNQFLMLIQKALVLMVQKMAIARNFFNYTVPKYYEEHWG